MRWTLINVKKIFCIFIIRLWQLPFTRSFCHVSWDGSFLRMAMLVICTFRCLHSYSSCFTWGGWRLGFPFSSSNIFTISSQCKLHLVLVRSDRFHITSICFLLPLVLLLSIQLRPSRKVLFLDCVQEKLKYRSSLKSVLAKWHHFINCLCHF